MANKNILIDETELNSPEFMEASRMFFKGRIYDLEKRLKNTEENLEIARAAANYNKKKLESWKNKYYTLVNQNQKNEKSI